MGVGVVRCSGGDGKRSVADSHQSPVGGVPRVMVPHPVSGRACSTTSLLARASVVSYVHRPLSLSVNDERARLRHGEDVPLSKGHAA